MAHHDVIIRLKVAKSENGGKKADFCYDPSKLTVRPGDTISWKLDRESHPRGEFAIYFDEHSPIVGKTLIRSHRGETKPVKVRKEICGCFWYRVAVAIEDEDGELEVFMDGSPGVDVEDWC